MYYIFQLRRYGPIYNEAFKLEERDERDEAAYKIVKKGLHELPRYGPLWMGLLRIVERRDTARESRSWLLGAEPKLVRLHEEASQAVQRISRELVWKVHFERAQAEVRAFTCDKNLMHAAIACTCTCTSHMHIARVCQLLAQLSAHILQMYISEGKYMISKALELINIHAFRNFIFNIFIIIFRNALLIWLRRVGRTPWL
jgi:hypothetical protein